jgi:hypothetical protein
MAMGTRKVGPAVAAGCTMVMKPAELTPLSSLAMTQILTEAGLPPGVLNVVTTTNAGATTGPIIADPRTRKLSFTGSTEVGKRLIAASAEQVLRVSMELGGNAPFLVFEDADLDAAVEGAVIAKMRNMGEACTAANRFHVHESIVDEFAQRLADRLGSMKLGRGTDEGVEVGPLIDENQRSRWLGAGRPETPATSSSRPCSLMYRPTPACFARKSSDRSLPSPPLPPTMKASPPPMTRSMAWSRTPTRPAWTEPCMSSNRLRRGWWDSTRAWCPTRRHLSVA